MSSNAPSEGSSPTLDIAATAPASSGLPSNHNTSCGSFSNPFDESAIEALLLLASAPKGMTSPITRTLSSLESSLSNAANVDTSFASLSSSTLSSAPVTASPTPPSVVSTLPFINGQTTMAVENGDSNRFDPQAGYGSASANSGPTSATSALRLIAASMVTNSRVDNNEVADQANALVHGVEQQAVANDVGYNVLEHDGFDVDHGVGGNSTACQSPMASGPMYGRRYGDNSDGTLGMVAVETDDGITTTCGQDPGNAVDDGDMGDAAAYYGKRQQLLEQSPSDDVDLLEASSPVPHPISRSMTPVRIHSASSATDSPYWTLSRMGPDMEPGTEEHEAQFEETQGVEAASRGGLADDSGEDEPILSVVPAVKGRSTRAPVAAAAAQDTPTAAEEPKPKRTTRGRKAAAASAATGSETNSLSSPEDPIVSKPLPRARRSRLSIASTPTDTVASTTDPKSTTVKRAGRSRKSSQQAEAEPSSAEPATVSGVSVDTEPTIPAALPRTKRSTRKSAASSISNSDETTPASLSAESSPLPSPARTILAPADGSNGALLTSSVDLIDVTPFSVPSSVLAASQDALDGSGVMTRAARKRAVSTTSPVPSQEQAAVEQMGAEGEADSGARKRRKTTRRSASTTVAPPEATEPTASEAAESGEQGDNVDVSNSAPPSSAPSPAVGQKAARGSSRRKSKSVDVATVAIVMDEDVKNEPKPEPEPVPEIKKVNNPWDALGHIPKIKRDAAAKASSSSIVPPSSDTLSCTTKDADFHVDDSSLFSIDTSPLPTISSLPTEDAPFRPRSPASAPSSSLPNELPAFAMFNSSAGPSSMSRPNDQPEPPRSRGPLSPPRESPRPSTSRRRSPSPHDSRRRSPSPHSYRRRFDRSRSRSHSRERVGGSRASRRRSRSRSKSPLAERRRHGRSRSRDRVNDKQRGGGESETANNGKRTGPTGLSPETRPVPYQQASTPWSGCRVYVANLPPKLTQRELVGFMEQAGPVVQVIQYRDGKSTARIHYRRHEDAQRAIDTLDRSKPFGISKPLYITRDMFEESDKNKGAAASISTDRRRDSTSNPALANTSSVIGNGDPAGGQVEVSNLPYSISDKDIRRFFNSEGTVLDIKRTGKTSCRLTFPNDRLAQRAAQRLHRGRLNGRTIDVHYIRPRSRSPVSRHSLQRRRSSRSRSRSRSRSPSGRAHPAAATDRAGRRSGAASPPPFGGPSPNPIHQQVQYQPSNQASFPQSFPSDLAHMLTQHQFGNSNSNSLGQLANIIGNTPPPGFAGFGALPPAPPLNPFGFASSNGNAPAAALLAQLLGQASIPPPSHQQHPMPPPMPATANEAAMLQLLLQQQLAPQQPTDTQNLIQNLLHAVQHRHPQQQQQPLVASAQRGPSQPSHTQAQDQHLQQMRQMLGLTSSGPSSTSSLSSQPSAMSQSHAAPHPPSATLSTASASDRTSQGHLRTSSTLASFGTPALPPPLSGFPPISTQGLPSGTDLAQLVALLGSQQASTPSSVAPPPGASLPHSNQQQYGRDACGLPIRPPPPK